MIQPHSECETLLGKHDQTRHLPEVQILEPDATHVVTTHQAAMLYKEHDPMLELGADQPLKALPVLIHSPQVALGVTL